MASSLERCREPEYLGLLTMGVYVTTEISNYDMATGFADNSSDFWDFLAELSCHPTTQLADGFSGSKVHQNAKEWLKNMLAEIEEFNE